MSQQTKLFVYGTLCPGKVNEHILKPLDGRFLPATITGELIELGWGSEYQCPAVKLNADGGLVRGYIFESNQLDSNLPMLDEFEGEEYERVLTQAQQLDGTFTEVFVYTLRE